MTMTRDDLRNRRRIRRRNCAVCGEAILFVLLSNGQPAPDSCVCRTSGERRVVDMSWSDFDKFCNDKAVE